MASAFSSSDTAALEREVDTNSAAKWNLENVWDDYQKSVCIEWVNKNKFAKVNKRSIYGCFHDREWVM